ncbi:MAG: coenzyme F420-0:L-glutamate ligase [Thaumarchaeota archaeon]|nr:coenzyme F420-0:L-glutamate ligase [Nitrososphaerota archaeon]
MEVIPVFVDAEITVSDNLGGVIARSADIRDGDVVVVAQKVASKQEGRIVRLSDVKPSLLAEGIASQYRKDPRLVELILSESSGIVRMRDGIIIVRTHSGLVCANAGIDESNVRLGHATLLPVDPDKSAQKLQSEIRASSSKRVCVILSDTFGRPLRMGQTDCAIGVAGLLPLTSYAGRHDAFGRTLRVTEIATADEIAAAAELVMQKAARCPAAIVRGCDPSHVVRVEAGRDGYDAERIGAALLQRPSSDDLFS